MTRVLVCGGRDYLNREAVNDTLSRIGVTAVIHGGATGADALAAKWAKDNCVEVAEYRADWKAHGRGAGPIRNQRMLDESLPDLVIAFPGGRGTADMVRRARKSGVEVVEVQP